MFRGEARPAPLGLVGRGPEQSVRAAQVSSWATSPPGEIATVLVMSTRPKEGAAVGKARADCSEPRRGATPVPHSTPLRGLATQAHESGIFNKSERSSNTAHLALQAQLLTSRVTCGAAPAASGPTPAHTLWPAWPPQVYFAVSIVFVFFCLAFTNQRHSWQSPWVLGLHPLWTGLGL